MVRPVSYVIAGPDCLFAYHQKVYFPTDRDGNIIAFLSSIGENTEGTLQLVLMDSDGRSFFIILKSTARF